MVPKANLVTIGPVRSIRAICAIRSPISKLALNQALRISSDGVNTANLQSSFAQKLLPISASSLLGAQQRDHHHVQSCVLEVGAGIRDDVLVDQKLAVARLHRGSDVGEDLEADVVGPVMENGVHEVCASALTC